MNLLIKIFLYVFVKCNKSQVSPFTVSSSHIFQCSYVNLNLFEQQTLKTCFELIAFVIFIFSLKLYETAAIKDDTKTLEARDRTWGPFINRQQYIG